MTFKLIICTIFHPDHKEFDSELKHFQPVEKQKMTISEDFRVLNFGVNFEEKIKFHINKPVFQTKKRSSFNLFFTENSKRRKHTFSLQYPENEYI
jgi:hypothetical protein